MSIQPKGEDLRKAVKWISEEKKSGSTESDRKLVDEACITFNLSPRESEYLYRFVQGKE